MTGDEYLKAINATEEEIANEEWRDIPGWEGCYQVSNLGRVRSFDIKILRRGIIQRLKTSKIMKVKIGKGYPILNLQNSGYKKEYKTCVLVLMAFVRERKKGEVSRHLDDNRINSRLNNLCWGTYKDNAQDAIKNGTFVRGEKNGKCKITKEDVILIRTLYKENKLNMKEMSIKLNISYCSVWGIVKYHTWAYIQV